VTPFARFVAVLLGVAGMVVAMAALVREAILAAEPDLVWRRAAWWERWAAGWRRPGA